MKASRRSVIIGAAVAGSAVAGPALAAAPALCAQSGSSGATMDPRPLGVQPAPPAMTAPAAVARLAGVDLWHWDTGGSGTPVILLHPATGSGLVWGYQQAAFAAAGHRTIGYSRRGFNGSSAADAAASGTAAGDLALLLDHLGIAQAHVVGTAAGGFAAASFAIEHPARVRTLTLACTILSPAERQITGMLTALREPWYNALPHDFRELSPSYRAINRDGARLWEDLHAASRGGNPETNQPPGEPATLAAIAGLTMPVLLISGDADLISPPPVARIFHRTIPDSELVVIPECGHSAYWERPDLFNEAVLGFLSRHA